MDPQQPVAQNGMSRPFPINPNGQVPPPHHLQNSPPAINGSQIPPQIEPLIPGHLPPGAPPPLLQQLNHSHSISPMRNPAAMSFPQGPNGPPNINGISGSPGQPQIPLSQQQQHQGPPLPPGPQHAQHQGPLLPQSHLKNMIQPIPHGPPPPPPPQQQQTPQQPPSSLIPNQGSPISQQQQQQQQQPPPPPLPPQQQRQPPVLNSFQKLENENSECWLAVGRLAETLGDYDRAMHSYEAALRHNRFSIPVLTAIANFYRSREIFPKAIEYFQSALDLAPDSGDIWGSIGKFFFFFFSVIIRNIFFLFQQKLFIQLYYYIISHDKNIANT